jgi:glycolate oxidase FAD binding subunit
MSISTTSEVTPEQLQETFQGTVEARSAMAADAVDGKFPFVVAAPRTEEAALELVKWCARENQAIVVRGSGSKLHWGATPTRCDVLLETSFLNEIFEHDEGNATVTAGAGISLKALNEAVGQHGQFVPLEGTETTTLGGLVATNSFGPSRLKYGAPRDLVLGVHAILSDGRKLNAGGKVVKNVSGYDLTKLFVGSFGTLGLITRVTIRLRPHDTAHYRWVGRYADWETAETQARAIFDGAFEPTSLQLTGTQNAVEVCATFDGVEAAVETQKGRLPATAEANSVDSAISAAPWEITATVPLQIATRWGKAARDAGARLSWDYGLGKIRAEFEHAPDVAVLRALAVENHGFMVVTRAGAEVKTAELVWGQVGNELALSQALKQKYDPAALFAPGRFRGGI